AAVHAAFTTLRCFPAGFPVGAAGLCPAARIVSVCIAGLLPSGAAFLPWSRAVAVPLYGGAASIISAFRTRASPRIAITGTTIAALGTAIGSAIPLQRYIAGQVGGNDRAGLVHI